MRVFICAVPRRCRFGTRRAVTWAHQVGSGGLYNNKVNESKPSHVADNKLGHWNTFFIRMVGDRVSVWLNGEQVVDNVIMENYWDRSQPIPAIDQIELQAHGSRVDYRNLYINELPRTAPYDFRPKSRKRVSRCCSTVPTCTSGSAIRAIMSATTA